MFNKIKELSLFVDYLKLVFEVEEMNFNESNFNALTVFKKFFKGETIKFTEGEKTLWIVRNQKTVRENKIVYIFKSENEHKKVWVKELKDGSYDFVVFDYNKAKHYDENSRFAFVYYPILKGNYKDSMFLTSPTSFYRKKDLEVIEIESLMM